MPEIVKMRHRDSREVLVLHLNVNSLQNKFEEVQSLITDFRAQIVFLTETKINSSYPNSQFKHEGYDMHQKDRAKGGGGVMAYIYPRICHRKNLSYQRILAQLRHLLSGPSLDDIMPYYWGFTDR